MNNPKPSHTTSIVSVRAGMTIPKTFLHKLITENRSAIGMAVQETNKIEIEKFFPLASIEKEMDNFNTILGATKNFQRMFCFSSFPEEYDEGEVQPWVVIRDSKGNPIIAVGIEGDLPGLEADGSSEMYGCITEHIGPKIEGLYELVGNNPEKLYTALKNEKAFCNDFLKMVGHRGHFFFMPMKGDIFATGKEGVIPQNGKFDWGAASFTYGYTESAVEAASVEKPEVKPSTATKVSKYASADPEPGIQQDDKGVHHLPEPKPEVKPPAVPEKPTVDPVAAAAAEAVKGHWETPPGNLHGKKLKEWYRSMDAKNKGLTDASKGDLTGDWGKRPRVWIVHQSTVKSLGELSHTAVANVQKVEQPIAPAVVPVITGEQQAKAVAFIKKYLGANSTEIGNPLEMQKREAKLAVFSELCLKEGGLDELEGWPTSLKFAFVKEHSEAAALALIQLIADRKLRRQMGDKPLKELTGSEQVEVQPKVEAPVIPAATPAEAHPAFKPSKYA